MGSKCSLYLSTRQQLNYLQTTLVPSIAPGHIPWSDVQDIDPVVWVPDGSIHPPEFYKLALSNARRPSLLSNQRSDYQRTRSVPPQAANLTTAERPTSLHPNALRRKSFRNAQVFQKEITIKTAGETERWSMDVPPSMVRSDTVDLVMSLQALSSFFQDDFVDMASSASSNSMDAEKLTAPSCNEQDSSEAAPAPLSGSDPTFLDDQAPCALSFNLASRRGQQELPHLTLEPFSTEQTSYPDIPSAFIGTPSYVPDQVELPSLPASSVPLHIMISNLRAQCKTLAPHTPIDLSPPALLEANEINPPPPAPQPEEDEWAFATELMTDLRCRSKASHEAKTEFRQQDDPDQQVLDHDKENVQAQPRLSPLTAPTSPPRSKLPSWPAEETPDSPTPSMRGILKGRKSVRFASLPGRRETAPAMVSPSVQQHSPPPPGKQAASKVARFKPAPRHSTGSTPSSVGASNREGKSGSRRPSLPSTLREVSHPPPSRKDPGFVKSKVREPSPRKSSSVPKPQASPARPRAPQSGNMKVSQGPISPVRPRARASTVGVSTGRTLTSARLPVPVPTTNKENFSSLKQPSASRRRSIFGISHSSEQKDENTRRRWTKVIDSTEDAVQRSRMPVPLQNIFTRFK